MGFGDFAMGYLVGQSFSGPNHIPDGNAPYSEWSAQAKKDWDKKCDEAYWRAWDRAFKEASLNTLAKGSDFSFLTFRDEKLYPHISKDRERIMFNNGELRFLVIPGFVRGFLWSDESREEAQDPRYLELQSLMKRQAIERGVQLRIV